MNFKFSIGRIVASLIPGLFCFLIIFDLFDSERYAYSKSKNDYENITQFWLVWDANEWIGGNREVIRNLLNQQTDNRGNQYELREGRFTFSNNKVVILHADDVFPGICRDMLYVSSDILDKAAQTAKEQAIKNAKQRLKSHEYWGTKSTTILISMVAALAGTVVSYLIISFALLARRAVYSAIRKPVSYTTDALHCGGKQMLCDIIKWTIIIIIAAIVFLIVHHILYGEDPVIAASRSIVR
jgi:hypothetical protein